MADRPSVKTKHCAAEPSGALSCSATPADITAGEARFAYEGLDRVIHEKARLGILTSLMTQPKDLAFGDLRRLCGLTDGNLSRHLKTLEDAGLITVTKSMEKKRPLTTVALTADGRERFVSYLQVLERVLKETAAVTGPRQKAAHSRPHAEAGEAQRT